LAAEPDPAGQVVVNSAWSLSAQGVSALVSGFVLIYAVRNFTAVSWGHYSTALALVTLATVISGAGLGPLALREMTADPDRQGEILGLAFRALAWTACVASIAVVVAALVIGYPRQVMVMVLVLVPLLALLPGLAILGSAFNARSRLVYVARFQLVQTVIYGALALAVVASGAGVTGLAVATVAGAFGGAIYGVVLLRRKLSLSIDLGRSRRRAFSFIRAATAFGAIGLVGVVYDRVDVLMLSVLSNARKVAEYTVPYGFLRLTWIVPSVVSAAFFPLLSRHLAAQREDAERLFFLVVRMFLFVSLPLSLALAVWSPTLLPFVFGSRYEVSVPVLQILAWTIPLTFLNYVLWYGAIAVHLERRAFLIDLCGLAANVVVNAIAIPLYGPRGAAWALVVSEVVILIGQGLLIHRRLFAVSLRALLLKPVLAGVVVIPVAVLLGSRSPGAGAVVGCIAYVVVLLAARYVSVSEWRPVFSTLWPFARLPRAG
jgi:O-antigen/teichoic acid export membrane protein